MSPMRLAVAAALPLLASCALRQGGPSPADTTAKEPPAAPASGLVYESIVEGKGARPTAGSTVKVSYEGALLDGKVFDSSSLHGGPVTVPLGGVIECWTQGVPRMQVGGKARLVCPPELAYGSAGRPPAIPPDATLVFQVELLEVVP